MIVTLDFSFDGTFEEKTVFTSLHGKVTITNKNNSGVSYTAVLFKTTRSFYIRFQTTGEDSELVTIELGLDLKLTADEVTDDVHLWATVNLLQSRDNQKYAPFKGESNFYSAYNKRVGAPSFVSIPFSFC